MAQEMTTLVMLADKEQRSSAMRHQPTRSRVAIIACVALLSLGFARPAAVPPTLPQHAPTALSRHGSVRVASAAGRVGSAPVQRSIVSRQAVEQGRAADAAPTPTSGPTDAVPAVPTDASAGAATVAPTGAPADAATPTPTETVLAYYRVLQSKFVTTTTFQGNGSSCGNSG